VTGSPVYPHGDPDRIIRSVLADPAYRSAAPTTAVAPQPSLLELAWNWFLEHVLRPLFHPLARALAASHGAGTIVGLLLLALALGLLAFVGFRLAVAFGRPTLEAAGSRAFGAREAATPAADWLAAARAAAARGAYGEAISALFRAALAELDERAIVAFDAARTPGEYRRAVRRARAAAAAPFDDLAERFVRAAFADATPQRAEFDAAERAFAAFAPALGS
jgi:hypothetical protein